MVINKKHSYWNTLQSHLPGEKTPGVPLELYCIPPDAATVVCDLEDFTCKDFPLMREERSLLQKGNSPPTGGKGFEIGFRGIIHLLTHIKKNRDHYCPKVGTQKWTLYPYKKLYFYRKDKHTFYITGEGWLFPVSIKKILTNKYTEK